VRFFTILLDLVAGAVIIASLLLFPSYFLSESKVALVENELTEFNRENPGLTSSNIDNITNDINSKLDTLDKAGSSLPD
jgi:hypothetical protein